MARLFRSLQMGLLAGALCSSLALAQEVKPLKLPVILKPMPQRPVSLTPAAKFSQGIKLFGAYDVMGPNCSLPAALGSFTSEVGFYPNNHKLNYSPDGKPLTVGFHVSMMTKILNDAFSIFTMAGDNRLSGRHVCLGMINYAKGPNAISHPQGYVLFDPRFMFIVAREPGNNAAAVPTVLMHEFAHQLQFWFGDPFRADKSHRRTELAADCIAGAIQAMRAAISPNLNFNAYASGIPASVAKLGDLNFEGVDHHGTDIERNTVAKFGVDAIVAHVTKNKTITGIKVIGIMNACNKFIADRDKTYGPNWPNVGY